MKQPKVFYGWIVDGASAVALLSAGGAYYGFGVFVKPLQAEFGWSHSLISVVQTVFYMAYGLSLYLSGKLSDRYGPRPLFAAGSLLLALGFGFSSRVDSVAQLIALYVVAGLGTGTTWTTAVGTVQRWFVAKRGLAVAVCSSGVGLGTLVFSPLLGLWISQYGWRTTYIIFGLSAAGLLASSIWFMAAKPEDKGLRPYGAPAGPNPGASEAAALRPHPAPGTWRTIRSYNFIVLSLSYFFSVVPISLIAVHFVPHAVESGMGTAAAASAMGFIGAMSVPGRIAGGVTADRLGWKRAMALFCFLGSGTLVWLTFSSNAWMFFLFAVLFGFSHGTRVPLLPGLAAQMFGTRSVGEIAGLITGLGVGLGGLGALLAGFIVDATGSYAIAFGVASASFVIAAVLAAMLRPPETETAE